MYVNGFSWDIGVNYTNSFCAWNCNWPRGNLLITTHFFAAFALIEFPGPNKRDCCDKLLSSVSLIILRGCFSHCLCGYQLAEPLLETYCSEQLWHASAPPYDHNSSLSWTPPLDLLGHTDGSVYVPVGVCPAVHISVLMCVFKRVLLCVCFAPGCCFSSSANDDLSLNTHTPNAQHAEADYLWCFLSVLHVCAIAFFFIRFISKISPQKVSNPVSVVLSHHLQPLSPSFPCFFPSLHPSLTISKLEALYQQLVSWPMAHVQKVKHPSLSVSMPTLLSAGIACAGKKISLSEQITCWLQFWHIPIPALLMFDLNFEFDIPNVSSHLFPEAFDKLCARH